MLSSTKTNSSVNNVDKIVLHEKLGDQAIMIGTVDPEWDMNMYNLLKQYIP